MRVLTVGLLAVAWMCSPAVSSPIVFEDSPPSRGDIQQQGTNRGSLQPIPGTAGAEGEGRIFHRKKKKKKKVICSIAGLIAGRDATGAGDSAAGRAEHRVARAVPQGGHQGGPQGAPQGPVQGDAGAQGRGLPPGTGFAGFLLGALVGSHLVSSYAAGPGVAYPHGPPVATQTQVQVQAPVVPVAAPVPVRPPVVNPAPVHEDYDEVEDDPVVGGGGGGYSICDQLQQRPEAGPLDSHFPLIAGILSGGGGGGGGGHQLPYRPPQHSPYGGYGGYGGGYAKPGGGLLYHYFKPWTDLFFK